jgi:flagellar L-ring protein precursor FlgH
MNPLRIALLVPLLAGLALAAKPSAKDAKKTAQPSALDRLILEAEAGARPKSFSPGSLYDAGGRFGDLARDQRAFQVNDIVTIVVADKASAVSKGATATSRKSTMTNSIAQLAGVTKTTGPLANLANMTGGNTLDGSGTTSRETTLDTTVSARVTHVLNNGTLVLEGVKDLTINSENQRVTIRGLVRPTDLSATNSVASDRLAELEIKVNGKGVVNDSIRRPNFLYRLLMNILPF